MQDSREQTGELTPEPLDPLRLTRLAGAPSNARIARPPHCYWALLLFLGPNFGGFLLFILFPVVLSLIMAFTNWSVKPAIPLRFVGLRNFVDMLGVNALEPGPVWLAPAYVLAVLAALAGLTCILLAGAYQWRGQRWGGFGLMLLGAVVGVSGVAAGGLQGLVIAGTVLLIVGLAMAGREDGDWRFGPAVLPALLLGAAAVALWCMHRPMWTYFEPRDFRFYYFFYNTLYLMIGIPFTIVGSMLLALLLSDSLPFSSRRQRIVGFLLCAACGAFAFCLVWSLGHENLALIALIFWLLAGLGFVFNVIAYRTIFYLPSFTSGIALMILWKALYNPETGPINVALAAILDPLGIPFERPNWLASVELAKPALVIMGFWIGIGGMNMLLYLAALANLPADLIDASKVDGAGPWTRLRHVIWPQLAPTTFFITIMSIIGGMQGGFEQARVMTYGGPAGSTTTLSYYIYTRAFVNLELGYAAAISWVLFALIFLATLIHWKTGKNIDVE